MMRRKINGLFIILSGAGAIAGWAAGEWMLMQLSGTLGDALLMGLYFGTLAFFIVLGGLLAETIAPRLNGANWRLRYAGDGWKWLVPASFALLLASGTLMQWAYGFDLRRSAEPQDYVVLLDMSESMKETDPQMESRKAAASLVESIAADKRIAIALFNEKVSWLQPLAAVKDPSVRRDIVTRLEQAAAPAGQTDIAGALQQAALHMIESGTVKRRGAVILLSDGYSPTDVPAVTAPYTTAGLTIHTVGLAAAGNEEGKRLLQQLAEATGGSFRHADQAALVPEAFGSIYSSEQQWHLMEARGGGEADSLYRAAARVAGLLLLGGLMGLSLGIVFDHRHLARSFLIGGAVAGLLAGLLLELSLPHGSPVLVRAGADLLLAVGLSASTFLYGVKENDGGAGMRPFKRSGHPPAPSKSANTSIDRAGSRFR
ncbi:vWA domain-containing protein [Paenibacillus silviterrae]|uniref:vWA domain-containing protein n=1 Tax=Paenibacillus silviterrae TaxID=3242194 RepID=UPI00254277FB|nr:vWA domain-containing protein [Paenibacillus chinjuensis]